MRLSLGFTITGGMSDECQIYHSRLAELLAVKKQESYAPTIAWIRTQVSFAILRSALVCLRGSRSRRTTPNIQETDVEKSGSHVDSLFFCKQRYPSAILTRTLLQK